MAEDTVPSPVDENGNGSYHLLTTPNIGLKKKNISSPQIASQPFGCSGSDESCIEFFLILRKDGRKEEAVWSHPHSFQVVLRKYPNIMQFVFVNSGTSYSVEDLTHTFVLTDGHGVRVYGHCTTFVNGEAVVTLSPFPWCRFFMRLAFLFRSNGYEQGKEFVKSLYRSPTPPSGGYFQTACSPSMFRRPYDRLCSFIDTSPLDLLSIFPDTTEFFSILAALLLEKHIIIVGPNFGLVSNVVMSVQTLISPFDWLHILIPILPNSLLDVLAAPPPYLVGLLTSQVSLLDKIPVESFVMIHLGASGKCQEVIYHNEKRHTLPNSGTFSALRIGYNTLKMRNPRDQTVLDLCSLFMTYYASLLGDIGISGAKGYIRSRSSDKDIPFYEEFLSTQCFNTLKEAVRDNLADGNQVWMDNEFIVAVVRGHPRVYPNHYKQLIAEERNGGGYAARYENCFGSREEFTGLSAAVHGFGGHQMSLGKLLCHCLFGCVLHKPEEEDRRTAFTADGIGDSISRRKYLSAPLDTPVIEMN